MERKIQFWITQQLFEQMEKVNEIHEKKTGVKQTISDLARIAISEKVLRR